MNDLNIDPAKAHKEATIADVLKFDRLRRPGAKLALEGFSVLDASCQSSRIGLEVIAGGAKSVVGLCSSDQAATRAKAQCPTGTFIEGSSRNLGSQKFDLIIFSDDANGGLLDKTEFSRLGRLLAPGGTLVLQCRVIRDGYRSRSWRMVESAGRLGRVPVLQFLTDNILQSFEVRQVGKGVLDTGETVQQLVFHCVQRLRFAILLTGGAGIGKSNLSRLLQRRNVPCYLTDELLSRLIRIGNHKVSSRFDALLAQKLTPANLDLASRFIEENGLARSLAEIIVKECPLEFPIFVVEGEAVKHPLIQRQVRKALSDRGIRVLIMTKLAEIG